MYSSWCIFVHGNIYKTQNSAAKSTAYQAQLAEEKQLKVCAIS